LQVLIESYILYLQIERLRSTAGASPTCRTTSPDTG
jgi:hypothetical protein